GPVARRHVAIYYLGHLLPCEKLQAWPELLRRGVDATGVNSGP
ncbi:hypothetical protein A2U01_0057450, partial [Trifolium medium]|nr:hypothetical protein [Trifolium medium]